MLQSVENPYTAPLAQPLVRPRFRRVAVPTLRVICLAVGVTLFGGAILCYVPIGPRPAEYALVAGALVLVIAGPALLLQVACRKPIEALPEFLPHLPLATICAFVGAALVTVGHIVG
jgi:hypothetical protein